MLRSLWGEGRFWESRPRVTNVKRYGLLIPGVIAYAVAMWATLRAHATATPLASSSITPAPPASAPPLFVFTPPPEFDMKKRDRQWDWCCAHHGVPTMTFTINGSNVICLKSEMVIASEGTCR